MVERVRQRFVEQGFDAALQRKQREAPARPAKLDGRAQARANIRAWTDEQAVELEVVDSISDETVRRAPKETRSSRT